MTKMLVLPVSTTDDFATVPAFARVDWSPSFQAKIAALRAIVLEHDLDSVRAYAAVGFVEEWPVECDEGEDGSHLARLYEAVGEASDGEASVLIDAGHAAAQTILAQEESSGLTIPLIIVSRDFWWLSCENDASGVAFETPLISIDEPEKYLTDFDTLMRRAHADAEESMSP